MGQQLADCHVNVTSSWLRVETCLGGGGELPCKSDEGACRTFWGLKMRFLVRVFSFKKSSVVTFVVPLRVEIR